LYSAIKSEYTEALSDLLSRNFIVLSRGNGGGSDMVFLLSYKDARDP